MSSRQSGVYPIRPPDLNFGVHVEISTDAALSPQTIHLPNEQLSKPILTTERRLFLKRYGARTMLYLVAFLLGVMLTAAWCAGAEK